MHTSLAVFAFCSKVFEEPPNINRLDTLEFHISQKLLKISKDIAVIPYGICAKSLSFFQPKPL